MHNRAIAPLAPGMNGSLLARAQLADTPIDQQKHWQLYTSEQRLRRDRSPWTTVQGILAPVQFLVFLVSLALIIHYLVTGNGLDIAKQSVVAKTLVLYLIMFTGAIWEKQVFGQYLFAPMFWWEDFVSMGVIALHTLYLAIAYFNAVSSAGQLMVALAAYAAYVINAAQFLHKLRLARRGQVRDPGAAPHARRIAP